MTTGVSASLALAREFPPNSTAEWEGAIAKDLKGADYDKRLKWRTDENIVVLPYYRAEHLPAPGSPPLVRGEGRTWEVVPAGAEPAVDIDVRPDHENGATAVQEVAFALARGAENLASRKPAARFGVAVGSNYFMEIAKLRALRLCWSQVAGAFGVSTECWVHAQTSAANKTLYDPYVNLLRVTTEAQSAVLGGCDSLTIRATGFDEHLAENVHHLLREECHLDHVADPAAGSYYIERLTDDLARGAWRLFQEIEAAGGKAAYAVEDLLRASREAKEKAVASRRRVLVGTNNYPNVEERELPAADIVGGGWRLAEGFERIRLRTERHARETGKTPRVLLLESGDLKMRKARSMFCQNLFGCAGFEMIASDELQEADLVVLCSSDAEYLALAREICGTAKAPVIVAGNPKEQIEALRSAGVADFVHVLSNALETLGRWQDRLGVRK